MKTLYFDLDGTLIDSALSSVASTQATFRRYFGMEIDASLVIERMGIPIEVIFADLSGGRVDEGNRDEILTYFRAHYRQSCDENTKIFAGIDDFLAKIAKNTDNLSIVTSKASKMAAHNLEKLQIKHYFAQIIGSDSVAHYKPHPDPVFKARAGLGAAPSYEMVIGDADTDIAMGRAAGVLTCAVTWGAHPKERLAAARPDFIAGTPDELYGIIMESMERGAIAA